MFKLITDVDKIDSMEYNMNMIQELSKKDKLKEYLDIKDTVLELSESDLLNLIASGKSIILKVWMPNCNFCKQYAPIFEKVAKENKDSNLTFAAFKLAPNEVSNSEFAQKFMTVNGQLKGAAPATMLFSKGELSGRHYGLIGEPELLNFINTGESPVNKKQLAQQELNQLYMEKGVIITGYENLPELNKRIKELEEILRKG